jgi:hypothetical protein
MISVYTIDPNSIFTILPYFVDLDFPGYKAVTDGVPQYGETAVNSTEYNYFGFRAIKDTPMYVNVN